MAKYTVKIAYIAVVIGFLVNPAPVRAAGLSGIWSAPETPVLVRLPEKEEVFVATFPVSKQRDARRKTVRVITAYSSTPDQTDDTPFITANGTRVRNGIVAANWLRFGTRVRIPEMFGDKIFTVTDRMHPVFDERMDIWFETREEAVQFGIRRLTVEVL